MQITVEFLPRYPVLVVEGKGVSIEQANGIAEISLDIAGLDEDTDPDTNNFMVLGENADGSLAKASFANVIQGITDDVVSEVQDDLDASVTAAAASATLAQAWAESATAPAGGSTKSAKTWAGLAEDYADTTLSALSGVTNVNAKYITVAAMLASTETARGTNAIWEAEGYRYKEAASGASDHHLTTAGSVKLYVLPGQDGAFYAAAFNIAADGSTDDTTKVQSALDVAAGSLLRMPANKTIKVYGLKIGAGTILDLNGSTFKKRAPVSGVDSDDLQAWTGSTVYYNGTAYRPILYLTGDNVTVRNGTLDGDRASDTIGRPTGGIGGSHEGGADRSGICGSQRAVSSIRTVKIENVRFVNWMSTAVNLDGVPYLDIRNCYFTNCMSTFINASGLVQGDSSSSTTGFYARITGCRMESNPLSWGNVPQEYVITGYEILQMEENIIDGRGKLTSIFTPFNSPDCGKAQLCDKISFADNTVYDTGLKLATTSPLVHATLTLTGNTIIGSSSIVSNCGIWTAAAIYRDVTITGNTLLNALILLETSPGSITFSGNAVRATRSILSSGPCPVLGFTANFSQTPGRIVVSGNTFDLGGYDRNVFLGLYTSPGDILVEGNTITGCDHLYYTLPASDFSAARVRFIGNRIYGNRTFGRFYHPSIAELTFKDNEIGETAATAPTSINSYTNRSMEWNLYGGAWSLIRFVGNTVTDSTGNFSVDSLVASGSSIGTLDFSGNKWLVAPSGNQLNLVSSVAATLSFLIITDNIMQQHMSISSNWTVTTQIVKNNTPVGAAWRIYNTSGNFGLIGGRGTTVGGAGGASALPATPYQYVTYDLDGSTVRIPVYL